MPQTELRKGEKGQILLIVVLASVISLTVGLAAISRSVTNTRVSTEESNSQKALSAAEAGLEEQINKINTASGGNIDLTSENNLSNKSNFNTIARPLNGPRFEINSGQTVEQDDGADVWLSTYPNFSNPIGQSTPATVTVYWNAPDANCESVPAPAIEIAVISGPLNNPNMSRYAVDSCLARRAENKFSADNVGSGFPAGYNQGFTFTVSNGRLARIIPIYADAKISIESPNLPSQGYEINSTGKAGDTVRQVRVYQGYPKLPTEFFPYNLFVP